MPPGPDWGQGAAWAARSAASARYAWLPGFGQVSREGDAAGLPGHLRQARRVAPGEQEPGPGGGERGGRGGPDPR